MSIQELNYSLIFQGDEIPLPKKIHNFELKNEKKENRKSSLNGTLYQSFSLGNLKFTFSWQNLDFSVCQFFMNFFNHYNSSSQPLYFRRQKPSGTSQTFEVILSEPQVRLIEISATGQQWGSLELEVITKKCHALTF